MASRSAGHPLILKFSVLVIVSAILLNAVAKDITLEFHHKFSDQVWQWAKGRAGTGELWWPDRGTVEYYDTLASHDRALRGQLLVKESYEDLTFANGNETLKVVDLGSLYYTIMTLGTPNVTFLVALDTGSDLLWVPCECQQCAAMKFGDIVFDTYSPSQSSTSQKVSCSSNLCDHQSACSKDHISCPYIAEYASANTSSSGILVEDILYLTTGDATREIVEAPIVFGCGEFQTGVFLKGAAPNGLLGLGMHNISIPSILSGNGLIADSFSMCFGHDNVGRINLGDKGSTDQQETALVLDSTYGYYKINITGIVVGDDSMFTEFTAIVDSGTSFTYLADPMYTEVTQSFNSQVRDKRTNLNFTFEYCYEISTIEIFLPELNLTTNGGSIFPVNDPTIFVSLPGQQNFFYCLAVLKSTEQNIIGQNFLTGLRVVFDREKLILGWTNFNCNESNSTTSAIWQGSSKPKVTKTGSNTTEVSVPIPSPNSSYSLHSNSLTSISLLLFILCLATI